MRHTFQSHMKKNFFPSRLHNVCLMRHVQLEFPNMSRIGHINPGMREPYTLLVHLAGGGACRAVIQGARRRPYPQPLLPAGHALRAVQRAVAAPGAPLLFPIPSLWGCSQRIKEDTARLWYIVPHVLTQETGVTMF